MLSEGVNWIYVKSFFLWQVDLKSTPSHFSVKSSPFHWPKWHPGLSIIHTLMLQMPKPPQSATPHHIRHTMYTQKTVKIHTLFIITIIIITYSISNFLKFDSHFKQIRICDSDMKHCLTSGMLNTLLNTNNFLQIFFYKAQFQDGSPTPHKDIISDFKWLCKDEIDQFVTEPYGKRIKKFI